MRWLHRVAWCGWWFVCGYTTATSEVVGQIPWVTMGLLSFAAVALRVSRPARAPHTALCDARYNGRSR